MLTPDPYTLAPLIPHPEMVRTRLERAQREADLLRRLLRLALRRQREAERLDRSGPQEAPHE